MGDKKKISDSARRAVIEFRDNALHFRTGEQHAHHGPCVVQKPEDFATLLERLVRAEHQLKSVRDDEEILQRQFEAVVVQRDGVRASSAEKSGLIEDLTNALANKNREAEALREALEEHHDLPPGETPESIGSCHVCGFALAGADGGSAGGRPNPPSPNSAPVVVPTPAPPKKCRIERKGEDWWHCHTHSVGMTLAPRDGQCPPDARPENMRKRRRGE